MAGIGAQGGLRSGSRIGRVRSAAVAGLAACAAAAGCLGDAGSAGEAGSAVAPEVRDSAGVVVVHNAAARPARWRVTPEPDVVVGAAAGRVELLLAGVAGAARLSDGRVAVADTRGGDVRYFDAAGRFLHRAVVASGGPGGFGRIAWFGHAAGDTLAVLDGATGRVTLLAPDGLVAGGWPVWWPATWTATEVLAMLPDRSLAVLVRDRTAPAGRVSGTVRERVDLIRLPPDSAPPDTLVSREDREFHLHVERGEGTATSIAVPAPLGPRLAVAAAGDRLVLGDGERYEVEVTAVDGSWTRVIRREHRPDPVTDGEADRYRRAQLAGYPAPVRPAVAAAQRAMGPSQPPARPAFDDLRLGADGTLWVRRFAEPDAAGRTWDVFSADGTLLAEIEIPAGRSLWQLAADRIVVSHGDAAPRVAVYQIVR